MTGSGLTLGGQVTDNGIMMTSSRSKWSCAWRGLDRQGAGQGGALGGQGSWPYLRGYVANGV